MTVRIAVLGLGEAGSAIGGDLVAAGADVRGYDPKPITVDGVQPRGSEAEAVADADLVLSLNSSHDAMTALENALEGLRPGTLWADLNTASPGLKVSLAERVAICALSAAYWDTVIAQSRAAGASPAQLDPVRRHNRIACQ